MARPKFIVIGDVMVDEYVTGHLRVPNSEGTPILHTGDVRRRPGGAGNVAMNLLGLGADVTLLGAIGDDEHGRWLKQELDHHSPSLQAHLTEVPRPTTLKLRYLDGTRPIIRVDREKSGPIPEKSAEELAAHLDRSSGKSDELSLIVSDYDKGTLRDSKGVLEAGLSRLQRRTVCSVADTKRVGDALSMFSGYSVVKLSIDDIFPHGIRDNGRMNEEWGRLCTRYLGMTGSKSVLLTLGERGVILGRKGVAAHFPAFPARVTSVVGAGDTLVAAMAFCLSQGGAWEHAVEFGLAAAAVVVEKPGTSTVDLAEVLERIPRPRPRTEEGIDAVGVH